MNALSEGDRRLAPAMLRSRVEHIYRRATERYPRRIAFAVIEGLPPLARIALAARVARRGQQFFTVHDEMATVNFERAVRAAEKAAELSARTFCTFPREFSSNLRHRAANGQRI